MKTQEQLNKQRTTTTKDPASEQRARKVRVRLSDVEHKDLLKKGLCFVCKDIWTRDHQCKTNGLNAAMIPEVSAKKQREGEHLEALMDWAVMGATVPVTIRVQKHKQLKELQEHLH